MFETITRINNNPRPNYKTQGCKKIYLNIFFQKNNYIYIFEEKKFPPNKTSFSEITEMAFNFLN